MFCLEGTVVLDLARRYPAAYTSMYMADFGADVIRIDPPGSYGPNIGGAPREEKFAAYFSLDRNKRTITLDLKSEEGREVLRKLASRADVLIEGFRPGVMDKLGLGYKDLSNLNPRLVYCALSGFGKDGPYVNVPAHDMNYSAIGGALSLVGERNGKPYFPSNLIADYAGAANHGLIGVLLALLAREKTGRGQFIDIAYLDTVIALLTAEASWYLETGVVPKRGETVFTGSAPWAQVFRCKDGEYFTIGAAEPHLWANLCRALGREDLIAEQNPTTQERTDQIVAELGEIFATRTRDEWWEYLRDKNACVGPVYNLNETFQDPQVLHREMVVEVDHPKFGKVKQTGIPIKMSDTPGSIRRLGVPTGSDTEAVIEELGYTPAEIANLRAKGVFG